jgi:segregation and condensation protein A
MLATEKPQHSDPRIHGEVFTALPQDLYIPPDALEVYLDAFEGPLDLLLYLIRKHNLDILDIPMAELTRQYMDYVEKMQALKLELAADYLLMSAVLIEIKSRMLLPKPTELGIEEDPRSELVRRLMEYEAIKLVAQKLDELPQVGIDISVASAYIEHAIKAEPPHVSVDDLMLAWQNVLKRSRHFAHHKVGKSELSVREHMSEILRLLKANSMMEFTTFFSIEMDGIAKLVVCFLAILELAKEGLIRITQQAAFTPIYVQINQ